MNDLHCERKIHEIEARELQSGDWPRLARRISWSATAFLTILIGIGTWGHVSRGMEARAALEARRNAVPRVQTLTVKEALGPRIIELPGTMAPFDNATLYARATGYIRVRHVDIGAKVHKGDVLALIAAPDLDRQLDQARAQLVQYQASVEQAQANADLGKVTNARTSRLVAQGWSSQQQGDQDRLHFASQTAAVAVAKANVAAQEAVVNRLEQLTSFEKILAPFDGVITRRFIDVGSLVTADAASGTPLFSIAREDVLRVQVYVPQASVFGLKEGDRATVTVPELPDRVFEGKVARNASALTADTRTLLTEIDVDNRDGTLTAGLYGIVHLQIARMTPVVLIPSQAVIFNEDGLSVAVVTDGKIELRKLDLDADNGANVEVRGGLKPGDRVILSPPANAVDGMRVQAS
ncbi:MAG TPA: efflux RND transporter periplasmic adaptor subunit [Methylocella sp.]|nr:efflux RND transporter periplasmic adaptor subunit [Methylocella sp.]